MHFINAFRMLLGRGSLGADAAMEQLLEPAIINPAKSLISDFPANDPKKVKVEKELAELEELFADDFFDKKTDILAKKFTPQGEYVGLTYDDFVGEVYARLIQQGEGNWKKFFNVNRPEVDVKGIEGYFSKAVKNIMLGRWQKVRDEKDETVSVHQLEKQDDENKKEPVALKNTRFKDPQSQEIPFDVLLTRLQEYIEKNDETGLYVPMFEVWWEDVSKLHEVPENVILKKYTQDPKIKAMRDKHGNPYGEDTLERRAAELKQLIGDFFIKVLKMPLTQRMKKRLNIASSFGMTPLDLVREHKRIIAAIFYGNNGYMTPAQMLNSLREERKKDKR